MCPRVVDNTRKHPLGSVGECKNGRVKRKDSWRLLGLHAPDLSKPQHPLARETYTALYKVGHLLQRTCSRGHPGATTTRVPAAGGHEKRPRLPARAGNE